MDMPAKADDTVKISATRKITEWLAGELVLGE
jgi:hypothetical protein